MRNPYELVETAYQRDLAVQYADYWAYRRNPQYASFEDIGGDCTNFVSQALYYANGVMNFTPTYGWYFIDLNNRAPAWTGVQYLWQFLTTNLGPGPFGHEVPLSGVQPGDIIQMAIRTADFGHSVIVTSLLSDIPDPDTILVAAHSNDANCRPISTYDYHNIRAIHIDGVRYINRLTDQPGSPEETDTPYPMPRSEEPAQLAQPTAAARLAEPVMALVLDDDDGMPTVG